MREVNKTPLTFLIDDVAPEDNAMLQALYSRSGDSVATHLEKVAASGSGKFMESFYVGYGHRSIGDCGTTTLFIEGVSNLVAKAIQDNSLYCGQESSTRYLDYSQQAIVDPYNMEMSTDAINKWLEIYTTYQPIVVEGLKILYPMQDGESLTTWEKAIKARSFDIMRGFLPVGVTTQLSWHTNLRQARDKLQMLAFHPLLEVQHVAKMLFDHLITKYPHSFKETDMHTDGNAVNEWLSQPVMQELYYSMSDGQFLGVDADDQFRCETLFWMPENVAALLKNRPPHAPIPRIMNTGNNFQCCYVLDFGSWRDMQRHRDGLCPVPVVTDCGYGINPWYISNARAAIIQAEGGPSAEQFTWEVENHLAYINAMRDVDSFPYDVHKHQYLYPMGLNLDCYTQCNFSQMVYISELRSTQFVHPTLRKIAQKMGDVIKGVAPNMALHVDYNADKWSIARGLQDIVKKEA